MLQLFVGEFGLRRAAGFPTATEVEFQSRGVGVFDYYLWSLNIGGLIAPTSHSGATQWL